MYCWCTIAFSKNEMANWCYGVYGARYGDYGVGRIQGTQYIGTTYTIQDYERLPIVLDNSWCTRKQLGNYEDGMSIVVFS